MIIIGYKFSVIPRSQWSTMEVWPTQNISLINIPNFHPNVSPNIRYSGVTMCGQSSLRIPFPANIHSDMTALAQWECYSNSNHNIDLHDCLSSGKDSPSSKLLFAKDIPLYRQLVGSFYQNIQAMPQVINVVLVCHENIFRYLDLINEKKYICFSCERVASIDLVLSFHNH